MKGLTPYQEAAMELILQHDRYVPITGKNLAASIGLKPQVRGEEQRDMRSIIHALRVKGWPVCANGKGYYWPQTQEELSEYVVKFQNRLNDQAKAIAGMRFGFDKVGKSTGARAVKSEKPLYYEAVVDGEAKCFKIDGLQEEAFLVKYPDARKI